jgi:hypothetical protein
MSALIVYHYTKGYHIETIRIVGELRPTTIGVPKGERPILWFSSNPVWEHTVSSHLGIQGTRRLGQGLYRIAIDTEKTRVYDWLQLKQLSQMHPRMQDYLEREAVRIGAKPEEWFGTFKPVPREQWVAIEVWPEGEPWKLWTPPVHRTKQLAKEFNRGTLDLDEVVAAYASGTPVIVENDEGAVLHGHETTAAAAALGLSTMRFAVVVVDQKEFEASDWPERLELARRVFMEKGGFQGAVATARKASHPAERKISKHAKP